MSDPGSIKWSDGSLSEKLKSVKFLNKNIIKVMSKFVENSSPVKSYFDCTMVYDITIYKMNCLIDIFHKAIS